MKQRDRVGAIIGAVMMIALLVIVIWTIIFVSSNNRKCYEQGGHVLRDGTCISRESVIDVD